MALSAGLHLRQSQSLVITPQLMQSIRLLQFTHVELAQFVEQEVEKNPLLEIVQSDANAAEDGRAADEAQVAGGERGEAVSVFEDIADADSIAGDGRAGDDGVSPLSLGDLADKTLSDSVDADMRNVFPDDAGPRSPDAPELLGQWKSMPGLASAHGAGTGDFDPDDFGPGSATLRTHVDQQIILTVFDRAERLIAREIADCLDEAGYIDAIHLTEIAERLGALPELIEQVLARLQTFDPPGIFARSLSECLAIQLKQKDRCDPAMVTMLRHLDLLARRDFQTLKRLCGVDEEDLITMFGEIRALDPKPGTRFDPGFVDAIVPDVGVHQRPDGSFAIELNPDALPRVLVNQHYYAEVSKRTSRNTPDHAFLTECMQNANWLARSLDQRARTILKVATEIVRQQDGFLTHGVDHLRPLNLKTVADAIGMHESTVSRVTSNKYMLTPRGVFELKYFFTVPIAAADGGDAHSAESVRHRIRTMIEDETATSVLSDDDIMVALKQNGINIARRTVAKYREAMHIPSSVQRRREKKARASLAGIDSC